MAVDVTVETVVQRPEAEVAAYAADPTHRRAWTPWEVRYSWEPADGATRVRLHVHGEEVWFESIAGPFVELMMRRAMRRELARFKEALEGRPGEGTP